MTSTREKSQTDLEAKLLESEMQQNTAEKYLQDFEDAFAINIGFPRTDSNIPEINSLNSPIALSRSVDQSASLPTNPKFYYFKRAAIWSIPSLSILSDTAEIVFGIYKMQGQKLVFLLKMENDVHAIMLGVIPTAFLLQSIAITKVFTIRNIDNLIEIANTMIRKKSLPQGWKTLKTREKCILINLLVPIALYSAIIDGIAGFYFVNQIPFAYKFDQAIDKNKWGFFAKVMGAASWANCLAAEGCQLFRKDREVTAGDFSYCSKLMKLPSYFLALAGGVESGIYAYVVCVLTFGVEGLAGRWLLFAANFITKFISDWFLNGTVTIESMDKFGKHCPMPQYFDDFVSLIFAILMAAPTADSYNIVIKTLLQTREVFPIPLNALSDDLINVFGTIIGTRWGINFTSLLYDQMRNLSRVVCCPHRPKISINEEENANTQLIPYSPSMPCEKAMHPITSHCIIEPLSPVSSFAPEEKKPAINVSHVAIRGDDKVTDSPKGNNVVPFSAAKKPKSPLRAHSTFKEPVTYRPSCTERFLKILHLK